MRGGWRDRRRVRWRARLRGPAATHPPRRVSCQAPGEGDPILLRCLRPAGAGPHEPDEAATRGAMGCALLVDRATSDRGDDEVDPVAEDTRRPDSPDPESGRSGALVRGARGIRPRWC